MKTINISFALIAILLLRCSQPIKDYETDSVSFENATLQIPIEDDRESDHSSSNEVYLCNSTNAKKYHLNKNCRGLKNCSKKIIKTALENAKKQGKTLCGWEK